MKTKFFLICLLCMCLSPIASAKAFKSVDMIPVSLSMLEAMAFTAKANLWSQARAKNDSVKLYLHWSAGHYGEFFDYYHLNIDVDGSIYASTADLSAVKSHTYKRNSGTIGISLACCFGATPKGLGSEPPTQQQIDTMAKVIAILARSLAIPINKEHVLTHGEAGDNEDGIFPYYEDNGRPYGMYGPFHGSERWDLAILKNCDPWRSGGYTLRLEAILAAFRLNQEKQSEIKKMQSTYN